MLEGKSPLQCYGLSLYLPSVVGAVAVLVEEVETTETTAMSTERNQNIAINLPISP